MARRTLLTRDERERLFQPRTDHFSIVRNYTLPAEDLEMIGTRRGAANRLGIAAHLSVLRYPGFSLQTNADLPNAALDYLASQLHVSPNAFEAYGRRPQTRSDHAAMVASYLGLRPFTRHDLSHAIEVAARAAARSDRGETIARILMDSLEAERSFCRCPTQSNEPGLPGALEPASTRLLKL
jgi:TnpA family transposase